MFRIRMGVPQMTELWRRLKESCENGAAGKDEVKLYKRLGKALLLLSRDPRHPGLNSHEIAALTARYGQRVWESYLENGTPSAGRIFWTYGPDRGDITVIGLEPHPGRDPNAYDRVTLSSSGKEI